MTAIRRGMLLGAFLLLGGVAACRADTGSIGLARSIEHPPGDPVSAAAPAVLELTALDIWAQPLPSGEATLTVTRDGQEQPLQTWPTATLAMSEAASYEITLAAAGYETLWLSVDFDGTDSLGAIEVRQGAGTAGNGLLVSREMREVDGRVAPVHSIYMGLRHMWFSAQDAQRAAATT